MNEPRDAAELLALLSEGARQVAATVHALRRGLPVERELLELVFGTDLAAWLVLRDRVTPEALQAASAAFHFGQPDRVRVIVTILPSGSSTDAEETG